ncbi:hypothetical protein R3P38DRAFT_2762401 [Favolaschia claudopus]|uniref:Uncharacterized protein n=1 Tax=Favolaschia claudopus TaxID=2862362 RepID=A0AAW0DGJ4_9AGAR
MNATSKQERGEESDKGFHYNRESRHRRAKASLGSTSIRSRGKRSTEQEKGASVRTGSRMYILPGPPPRHLQPSSFASAWRSRNWVPKTVGSCLFSGRHPQRRMRFPMERSRRRGHHRPSRYPHSPVKADAAGLAWVIRQKSDEHGEENSPCALEGDTDDNDDAVLGIDGMEVGGEEEWWWPWRSWEDGDGGDNPGMRGQGKERPSKRKGRKHCQAEGQGA